MIEGGIKVAVVLAILTLLSNVLVYDLGKAWQDEAQIVGWGRELLGYDANRASLDPESGEQYVLFAPLSQSMIAWADENVGRLRHRIVTMFFALLSGVAMIMLLLALRVNRGVSVIAGLSLFMDPMYLLSWSGGRADSIAFFFAISGSGLLTYGLRQHVAFRWMWILLGSVFFVLSGLSWITSVVLLFQLVALILGVRGTRWLRAFLSGNRWTIVGLSVVLIGGLVLLSSLGNIWDVLIILYDKPGSLRRFFSSFNWNYPLLVVFMLALVSSWSRNLVIPLSALVIASGVFMSTDIYVFRAIYLLPVMYAILALCATGRKGLLTKWGLLILLGLNFIVSGYFMPGMKLRNADLAKPDKVISALAEGSWTPEARVYCAPWELVMLGYGYFQPVRHFTSFRLSQALELREDLDYLILPKTHETMSQWPGAEVICDDCGDYGPYLVVSLN
ncbi:hypothetical protein N9L83_03455 [Flavobacteriales bacterium]|nr:hypothetical protein [Flavobacteriales bacterium]